MGDKAPTNDGGQFWKLPHLHHSSIAANLYVRVYDKFPQYSYSLAAHPHTMGLCALKVCPREGCVPAPRSDVLTFCPLFSEFLQSCSRATWLPCLILWGSLIHSTKPLETDVSLTGLAVTHSLHQSSVRSHTSNPNLASVRSHTSNTNLAFFFFLNLLFTVQNLNTILVLICNISRSWSTHDGGRGQSSLSDSRESVTQHRRPGSVLV